MMANDPLLSFRCLLLLVSTYINYYGPTPFAFMLCYLAFIAITWADEPHIAYLEQVRKVGMCRT